MHKRPWLISTLIITSLTFGFIEQAAASTPVGNARVQDWTCYDNSFLPGGVAVVGKSYTIDPELYRKAKIGTLKFSTIESKSGGKSKITFKNVQIEIIRGKFKTFEFAAGIGHTFVLGKSYKIVSNSFLQKLNLSYIASDLKVNQLALSPSFISTSKLPIDEVRCQQSESYERIANPASSTRAMVSLADKAKVGDICVTPNFISFGLDGPLECIDKRWIAKNMATDSVATRAYRSLIARYKSMPESKPNLLLRIDPNAGDWKNDVASGITAGARLWGTSKESDKPIPSYISETGEYVSAQLAADGIPENDEDAKRNRDAAAQGRGQAGSHGRYFDFIFSEASANSSGFYQVGAHEYTHYAQQVLSNNRTGMVEREFWIDEGCATLIGTGMGAVLSLPQDQRASILENLGRQKNKMPLKFFSRGSQNSYADPRINEVYDTGFFACEALFALKGFEGIESVYKELSSPTANYDKALKAVYGVGLDALIPFLQSYIDSVRNGKPLTLPSLEKMYSAIGGK